jgi:hypothetical protein
MKGGVLVWPILFCSMIGTTIFFYQLLMFRTARHRDPIIGKVLQLFQQKNLLEAKKILVARVQKLGTLPVFLNKYGECP